MTNEERIDNYLLGRMTSDERKSFEQELTTNTSLKDEFEAQKEIAQATQRVWLKEYISSLQTENQKVKRPRQRIPYILSLAACLALVCFGGWRYSLQSNSLQSASNEYLSSFNAPFSRSGDSIDELLVSALESIETNNTDKAKESIANIYSELGKNKLENPISEEEIYLQQKLDLQQDCADWLNAICLMKEGKVFKAKSALKDIAKSTSPFASDARNILENNL